MAHTHSCAPIGANGVFWQATCSKQSMEVKASVGQQPCSLGSKHRLAQALHDPAMTL